MHGDCTNHTRPCRIHDEPDDWHIVFRGRRIHGGWLVAALVTLIALSTLPGLN